MAQSRKNHRKRGFGAKGILPAVLLILLVSAGGAAWLVLTPFEPAKETVLELEPGSSAFRIGEKLEFAGVIRSQYAFDLVRLWKRGTLQAGLYKFDHPASVLDVYSRIQHGDIYTKTVVVPEGSSIFDIAIKMEQAGFGTRQQFLQAQADETSLVADLDPRARSLEGYLFPDTYAFAGDASPIQIVVAMVKRFRQVATQLGLRGNVHDTVTLASLVERETAVDSERPVVASVFENRLAKHMPLMTDPSVIYGLQLNGVWRGTIYQSDLRRNTPYNTYLHAGLPPGPVANPGIRSLRAAMDPAHTNYLYFVAAGLNPQGHSIFASTLEEHSRNVADYRQALKKAGGR
ncbi:MAG TPA: endolytic transglycosylase MltG [Terracidiphilus sp.]|nr:endolytic transglycosylase MltG [Terracidiphilus sp.]